MNSGNLQADAILIGGFDHRRVDLGRMAKNLFVIDYIDTVEDYERLCSRGRRPRLQLTFRRRIF